MRPPKTSNSIACSFAPHLHLNRVAIFVASVQGINRLLGTLTLTTTFIAVEVTGDLCMGRRALLDDAEHILIGAWAIGFA